MRKLIASMALALAMSSLSAFAAAHQDAAPHATARKQAASMPVAAAEVATKKPPVAATTRCRDAAGKFEACSAQAKKQTCRDSKGRFAACKS